MDFYFAGQQHKTSHDLIVEKQGNMLKSYHNDKLVIKELIQARKSGTWKGKLLVDSGAYTCWTQGIEICPDTYIEYINENCDYVDYFIQLDTIPGKPNIPPTLEQAQQATEQSWQNYLYMTEKVKCPEKILPVYHKGEPLSHLKRIVEHQINGEYVPYICLGGSAKDRAKAKLMPWYHTCLDVIYRSKNPNVKIHVLGQTIFDVLETLPFESCDSTTWIMTNAVGNIMSDFGSILVSKEQQYDKSHINHQPKQLQDWVKEKCDKYELDYNDLQENYKFRALFNVSYIIEWCSNYRYKGRTNFVRKKLF